MPQEQAHQEEAAKAAPVKPKLPSWTISASAVSALKAAANPNAGSKAVPADKAEPADNNQPEAENKQKEDDSIDFSASSNDAFLSSISQEKAPRTIKPSDKEFGSASGGHRRKAAAEQEAHAPKKRHSVSSSFISGNLQQDVFNHHH